MNLISAVLLFKGNSKNKFINYSNSRVDEYTKSFDRALAEVAHTHSE